ncbi:C-type lectin domain family 12 member B [Dissostichus eleginoides]|uniref:C-type lectin domain family 12 member B n=1 Tax=Dissostichus eleginoides TaxID=100907 RepID=A0AAD9C5W5_DISEL|nr:C-type lectin domain family 12 member B [Dissostichus eleginoides]
MHQKALRIKRQRVQCNGSSWMLNISKTALKQKRCVYLSEEIEEQEEVDYVNASRGAVDKKRTRPGSWFLFFTQNILLIAVCWLVLLAIMGLRIYCEFHNISLLKRGLNRAAVVMAEGEEEVNYASVVFKAGSNPPPAAKRGEDTVYGEVKVQNERKNKDSAGHRCFQHLACCLGILCVILLGGIIGLCVYRVEELKTRNQELETKTNNLTQQIQDMTTNWNELNVSRAQWSIDSYCLGNTDKKCQPCQRGWRLFQPSCYGINNPPSSEEITEEADYVNAPEGPADKKATRPEDTKKEAAPEGTVDTKASPPGLRCFLPIAVCWIILLAIMGLRIYFTSELSEDNAKQTAEILNLTSRIQELETRENLTVRWDNLTQAYTVLESNVKDLNKLNQELETKKNNLTQQIQDMTTNWNELNVSRAQWSIDSYCLGNTDKKCQPCQNKGWTLIHSSCYGINNPPSPGWKTWAEAREDCKGKNSNLSVVLHLEVNPLI